MKPWKPIHVLSLRPEYTPHARSPKGGRPCGLAGDIVPTGRDTGLWRGLSLAIVPETCGRRQEPRPEPARR